MDQTQAPHVQESDCRRTKLLDLVVYKLSVSNCVVTLYTVCIC